MVIVIVPREIIAMRHTDVIIIIDIFYTATAISLLLFIKREEERGTWKFQV